MKSLMFPPKVFHHPSELCEVVTKGSVNGFTLCMSLVANQFSEIFDSSWNGYAAVNFLFQLIFVFLLFKFFSIHYHTQKQWKNKN